MKNPIHKNKVAQLKASRGVERKMALEKGDIIKITMEAFAYATRVCNGVAFAVEGVQLVSHGGAPRRREVAELFAPLSSDEIVMTVNRVMGGGL